MVEAEQVAEAIGAHWDQRVTEKRPTRWMTHPWVVAKVNRLAGEIESETWGAGLLARLQAKHANELPFRHGIAVACGNGLIELDLVKRGIVERFECFDFAEQRIAVGRKRAEQAGLSDRITYHASDAFAEVTGAGEFDFVHWRNAIHHMLDTREAIAWSARCLAPGGVLYLDDYVGPSRFQYPDDEMAVFNEVYAALPRRFLARSDSRGGFYPRRLERPDEAAVIRVDPSEAADSANIVPALLESFPDADIVRVSGGLFQAGLHDIMGNFDPERDAAVLNLLWAHERTLVAHGHLNWAQALARKA
jgi:SAM-dependent methyltransferase